MCKRSNMTTMEGPATIAVDRLIQRHHHHKKMKSICLPRILSQDSLDMKVMNEATDMISEPFPGISWSSNELVSIQEDKNKFIPSTKGRRTQFFRMSLMTNTYKRKRTVSCEGCLVRSPEVFESILLVKDGDDVSDGADGQEQSCETTTTNINCRRQQLISKQESVDSKGESSCCVSESFENQDSITIITW